MGKVKDITGQRFGRLVAQYYKLVPNPKTGKNVTYWHCKCDCGNEKDIRRGDLQQGRTLSCGCYGREQSSKALKENLVGQRFGRLIVLEDTGKRVYKSVVWKCRCDCGNIIEIYAPNLKSGDTRSCGCLHREQVSEYMSNDISNQKFGRLLAIEPTNKRRNGKVVWKCQCDCGNIAYVASTSLVNGNTMSCGCLKSKGEQKITQILQQNHIGFKREYIFSDFPNKRFDFYVPCCSLCIEYDGIQHFDKTNPYYSDNNIKRDREKDSYCNKNNIILVRIPYTDYHKISLKYILDRIEGE